MIQWESFDKNEIWILILLVITYIIAGLLPKKLPRNIALLSFLWGIASGMLFDFTIGGGLLDYYKVNDTHGYGIFDFLYYLLFAPFSYYFIYFYEKFEINKKSFVWYVLGWSILGLGMNWFLSKLGIIHFQHGYKLSYSFSVFLFIQTITILYYELIKYRKKG
ncbi:hypothetical protein JOC86_004570 [Bacillus pakistanensis]|uniref:Rod shape-determining protein MreD n=1 Tax=Rossellomorea pakistanensis TaxID=992288 RepID=A0ABS2NJK0_9BACI|nr:hypothetical protein [Bacillus pakistanensis]MBM7587995.1 hypothetical protein [Bacillus pakistanensis]